MTSAMEEPATPEKLHSLAIHGLLNRHELEAALEISGARPTVESWWNFARRTLLTVGGALVVVGVIFFIAANWQELSAAFRMGLVVTGMLGAALVAMRAGLDALSGRVACVVCGALVGPLFALFGQTYQTGADAWELFAAWLVLFIPFTVASRLSGSVILAMVLLHLSVGLWWEQVHGSDSPRAMQLVALAVDGGLAVLFELGALQKLEGLRDRVAARAAVITCSMVAVVPAVAVMEDLLRGRGNDASLVLIGVVVVGATIAVYGWLVPDMSLLSLGALGLVSLVTAAVVSFVAIQRWVVGGILLTGVAVIAQVLVAAQLLRAWSRARGAQP